MGIIFLFWWVFVSVPSVCIGAPVNNSRRWKRKGWEWNAGKDETPPVRGVCGCSFLGISCVGSWLSRSDSILLFVLCGPGSVCGCESISAILLCYIAFGLVPVGRHRWARLFWLVAGTNAHRCSFGCIYASWLGRFWSLFLVLFCFYVFFDKGGLIVFITTSSRSGDCCMKQQMNNKLDHKLKHTHIGWH